MNHLFSSVLCLRTGTKAVCIHSLFFSSRAICWASSVCEDGLAYRVQQESLPTLYSLRYLGPKAVLWLYCSQPLRKFKTTVKPTALTSVVKCPWQAREPPSAFPQVFCACGLCRRGGGSGLRGMRSVPCCWLSCCYLVFLRVHLYTPQSSGTVALTLPHTWASAGGIRYKVSFPCAPSGVWPEAWGVPQPAVCPQAPRGLCCRPPWACRSAALESVLLRALSLSSVNQTRQFSHPWLLWASHHPDGLCPGTVCSSMSLKR